MDGGVESRHAKRNADAETWAHGLTRKDQPSCQTQEAGVAPGPPTQYPKVAQLVVAIGR